jgi:hypothetical protein
MPEEIKLCGFTEGSGLSPEKCVESGSGKKEKDPKVKTDPNFTCYRCQGHSYIEGDNASRLCADCDAKQINPEVKGFVVSPEMSNLLKGI